MGCLSELLLLSGGIDSSALAWWKRPKRALTLDYGQLAAEAEIRSSRAICADAGIRHDVLRIDCSAIGSGDMAGLPASAHAPVTEWWPYRNQLLVTFAAAHALQEGLSVVLIGVVTSDAQHVDGSAAFIAATAQLLQLQEGSLSLHAPAASMSSTELVYMSKIPREVLAWAHSCHVANYACGACRGCYKRARIMVELDEKRAEAEGDACAP